MAVSTLVTAIGIAAAGVIAVAAVSLMFYVVGRSEDRDRAAERGRAGTTAQPVDPAGAETQQPGPPGRRRGLRHRLARRRGAQD